MGFHLKESRSRESHPPAKSRVWGFFSEVAEMSREKSAASKQAHWEDRPSTTETASGVSYYGYRYYDPKTGRWPSRDPLGENWDTGEFNEYAFILNEAIGWIDILGLKKNKGNANKLQEEIKAAVNAGINARKATNEKLKEHCGLVCRHRITGKLKVTMIVGKLNSCKPLKARCGLCYKKVRAWHTHPPADPDGDGVDNFDSERFSNEDLDGDGVPETGDIPFSEHTGLPFHLNTPGGQNLSYNPSTNSINKH